MSISISYGELKNLVTQANKTSSNKSFDVLARRIQKEYAQQNKDEIKFIKQLIKKVTDNKASAEDLSILNGNLTKEQQLEQLEKLLNDKKTYIIPLDFTILIETLPKTLQKLKLSQPLQTTQKQKIQIKKSKNEMEKIREEQQKENEVFAKQVTSIEPLSFFTLLPFYTLTPEQSNILKEILDLDEETLMPNKYTIFERFNTIVEKKHLTGEYFEYNVKQSDISKKFMELEPQLRQTLFDFTKLNKKAIQKARQEMREFIQIVEILYDLQPKNYSSLAPIIINNIIRIYTNLIKNTKNDDTIIKYLVRNIELLEYRKQKLHEEIPQLLKDDDKRKFLTKEIANILETRPETQPQQTNVEQGDEELGEHYNDRFEDEGFDDLELDIVEDDDSLLLGGDHFTTMKSGIF